MDYNKSMEEENFVLSMGISMQNALLNYETM